MDQINVCQCISLDLGSVFLKKKKVKEIQFDI